MKRALHSFAAGDAVVAAGSIVDDDHPILDGRDGLFEDVEPHAPTLVVEPVAEPVVEPARKRR